MPTLLCDVSCVLLPLTPSGVTNRLLSCGRAVGAPDPACTRTILVGCTTSVASGATLVKRRSASVRVVVGDGRRRVGVAGVPPESSVRSRPTPAEAVTRRGQLQFLAGPHADVRDVPDGRRRQRAESSRRRRAPR